MMNIICLMANKIYIIILLYLDVMPENIGEGHNRSDGIKLRCETGHILLCFIIL